MAVKDESRNTVLFGDMCECVLLSNKLLFDRAIKLPSLHMEKMTAPGLLAGFTRERGVLMQFASGFRCPYLCVRQTSMQLDQVHIR